MILWFGLYNIHLLFIEHCIMVLVNTIKLLHAMQFIHIDRA